MQKYIKKCVEFFKSTYSKIINRTPKENLVLLRKNICEVFVSGFLKLGGFRWIIEESDSGINYPGFRIYGVTITYYKWSDTFIVNTESPWREAEKRELNDPNHLYEKDNN